MMWSPPIRPFQCVTTKTPRFLRLAHAREHARFVSMWTARIARRLEYPEYQVRTLSRSARQITLNRLRGIPVGSKLNSELELTYRALCKQALPAQSALAEAAAIIAVTDRFHDLIYCFEESDRMLPGDALRRMANEVQGYPSLVVDTLWNMLSPTVSLRTAA